MRGIYMCGMCTGAGLSFSEGPSTDDSVSGLIFSITYCIICILLDES